MGRPNEVGKKRGPWSRYQVCLNVRREPLFSLKTFCVPFEISLKNQPIFPGGYGRIVGNNVGAGTAGWGLN